MAVAVAVAVASSCSSDLTPSLGVSMVTSAALKMRGKKKKEKERQKESERKNEFLFCLSFEDLLDLEFLFDSFNFSALEICSKVFCLLASVEQSAARGPHSLVFPPCLQGPPLLFGFQLGYDVPGSGFHCFHPALASLRSWLFNASHKIRGGFSIISSNMSPIPFSVPSPLGTVT